MLLDDVMSELDATERERLVEAIGAGGQAVVTGTDLEHVPGAEGGRRGSIVSGRAARQAPAA